MTDDTTTTTDAPAEDTTTTPEVKTPQVVLGQPVVYVSGKGKAKVGLVTGTPESVKPGSSLGYTLEANEVTVYVISPSGRVETKKKIAYSEAEDATRVWRLV